MPDRSFTLQILVSAVDQASSVLGGIGGAAHGLGIAVLGGAAVATTALVTVGTIAVSVGQDYDDAMDILSSRTGITGSELQGMGQSVKTLEGDFVGLNRSMGDIATIMAEVRSRTGETGGDLEDLTRRVLTLSDLTGTDAQTNVANLTRVFGDWGVAVEDQAGVLDTLFAASQQTGIGLDTLSERIVQFGAPLRQMGFSFEESVAMLGKWEKEGVNTELVLGSLRIAAGNFADAGIDLRDGLMQTFDAIKNARTESEALQIAMDVFGARAGPDMAAAIREGRFEIDDLVASLQNSGGSMDAAAQGTIGFSERWQMALNQMKIALEPLGTKLLELGLQAMPLVQGAITTLTGFIQDPLMPILETATAHFGSIVTAVGNFMTALGAGQNPISAFQKLIFDLSGGNAELATKVGSVVDGVLSFIEKARTIVEPITNWIAKNVELKDVLFALGVGITAVVLPVLASIVEATLPVIAIFAAITLGVALLRKAWQSDFLGIRTLFEKVWNEGLKPAFEEIRKTLGEVLPPVIHALTDIWNNDLAPAFEELGISTKGDLIPILGDALVGAIKFAAEAVKLLLEGVVAFLPTLKRWAEGFAAIIRAVKDLITWVSSLNNKLVNLKLPKWLMPGSPTPFEIGLIGINEAMRQLASSELPRLNAGFSGMGGMPLAGAGAGAGGGGGSTEPMIHTHIYLDGREIGYAVAPGVKEKFQQDGTIDGGRMGGRS